MPVPGFTWLYLGLLWSVLDHQRMVLDAQTYTWDGWMGWKSWNASLLWGHPDCPECINSGKTVRGGQFRSKNVCIFLYSELTCWSYLVIFHHMWSCLAYLIIRFVWKILDKFATQNSKTRVSEFFWIFIHSGQNGCPKGKASEIKTDI